MTVRVLTIVAVLTLLFGIAVAQTPSVQEEIRRGQGYYSRLDFASASKSFEKVLQEEPSNVAVRLLLGHSLWEIGDYPGALAAYLEVIRTESPQIPLNQRRAAIDRVGEIYGMSGQLDKAETWYKSVIAQDPDYPHYYYNLACTFAEKGDHTQTIANLKLALERKDKASPDDPLPNPVTDTSFRKYLDDPDFLAVAVKFRRGPGPPNVKKRNENCDQIIGGLGELPDSRDEQNLLFERARSRAHLAGDSECEVMLFMFQAKVGWVGSHPEDAFIFYREAADLAEKNNLWEDASLAMQSLGDVHRSNGNYSVAADVYDKAEEFARRAHSDRTLVRVINAKGLLAAAQNDSSGALKLLTTALSLARKIGDKESEAWIVGDIGGVYSQNGRFELALNEFLQAVDASQNAEDPSLRPAALLNLGITYQRLGMSERARSTLEKADSLLPQVIEPALPGRIKNALAELAATTGRPADAIPLYLSALALKEDGHDYQGAALTVANVGAVLLQMGDYDRADKVVTEAMRDAESRGDTFQLALFWDALGVVREALKDEKGALENYLKSIEIRSRIRTATPLAALRAAQAVLSADAYERAVYLLAKQGRKQEAFDLAERARARTFVELLADPRIKPTPSSLNPELLKQQRSIRASMNELEERLRRLPAASTERSALLNRRVELERRYQDVAERLEAADPGFSALAGETPATLTQIETDLPEDVTLLSLFLTSSGVLAFIVKHGTAEMQLLPATKTDLIQTINGYRSFSSFDVVPDALTTLYQELIAPIHSRLGSGKLYIEPHDVLNLISFAALTPDKQTWFGNEHTIVYLPAAGMLHALQNRKRSPARTPLVAFAQSNPKGVDQPLLHADAEVDAVAGLFGGEAVHHATEADFFAKAPSAEIVHIAAHAELNGAEPSLSAIILAPSPGLDGLLHVDEILDTDLSSATLVVLAACDSGFGPQAAGDEISSLHRSFLIAGASSVVASLWKVDDNAAASFMDFFYTLVKSGKSPAEALGLAQEAVRKQQPHPFFWAGYTLTGESGWR